MNVKRVTKVKFRGNKRIAKKHSSVVIKNRTNKTKLADTEKGGFGHRGNLFRHGKIGFKDNTKISSRFGRKDRSVRKRKRYSANFVSLFLITNYKEFSF